MSSEDITKNNLKIHLYLQHYLLDLTLHTFNMYIQVERWCSHERWIFSQAMNLVQYMQHVHFFGSLNLEEDPDDLSLWIQIENQILEIYKWSHKSVCDFGQPLALSLNLKLQVQDKLTWFQTWIQCKSWCQIYLRLQFRQLSLKLISIYKFLELKCKHNIKLSQCLVLTFLSLHKHFKMLRWFPVNIQLRIWAQTWSQIQI